MCFKFPSGACFACCVLSIGLCSMVAALAGPGFLGDLASFDGLKGGPPGIGRGGIAWASTGAGSDAQEGHASVHQEAKAVDAGPVQAALIDSLDKEGTKLRDAFNGDRGKVRLVLILSPT